jgi:predicted branched-subunit amino acid permease
MNKEGLSMSSSLLSSFILHPSSFILSRAVFASGLRAGIPVGLTFLLAFLGVGAAFHGAGLGQTEAGLSTLLLMSGPAQFGLLDGLDAGRPLLATVLAVCMLNGRYAVMSAVLAPHLRAVPLRRLLLPLTLLSTSTFAVTAAGLRRRAVRRAPLAYFQGVCLAAVPPAILGTVLGYHLTGLLPGALAGTVDMILPVYFATLLAREWPRPSPLLAALLGFVLTPLAEGLLPGFGLLLPGVAVGLVFAWVPEREAVKQARQ